MWRSSRKVAAAWKVSAVCLAVHQITAALIGLDVSYLEALSARTALPATSSVTASLFWLSALNLTPSRQQWRLLLRARWANLFKLVHQLRGVCDAFPVGIVKSLCEYLVDYLIFACDAVSQMPSTCFDAGVAVQ